VRVNDDTQFILKRMDAFEERVITELKELQAFRNRMIGVSIAISFVVSSTIEILRKLGG
jgi:hypothetical protein